jgi:hypothetical protein
MRTLILLSTLVILAACADDQHATAPANSRSLNSARSTAAGDARASSQLVSAQGKPTDAVGFTKITTVISTWTFPANGNGFAHTDCPVGTTVIGGGFGYDLPGGFPIVPAPSMIGSGIVGTGWQIALINNQPGAISWTIEVAAYCAS